MFAVKGERMDHLACMTTFAAVVERGGFAAAARHLSVAPASVTRHVLALEHRIGARLLHRTTRKCTPTEAGRVFYERGVKILEDIRDADAIASEFHSTSRGTVRIQTSPTLSVDVMGLISRYRAIHPETSFDVTTAAQMGDLLGDGIDLAFRDDPVPESSLIVRCLACAEWTPCAALDYVARYGLPARPAELKDHNCLVYARGHDCDEWRFTSEDGEKAIRISGDLRSTDPHAVRTATLAAHGVALLPDAMISKDLQAGRLIRVLSEYSAEPATVRAIYPSRRQLARKVRTFLDFAAASFGGSLRVEFRAGAELRGRAPLRDEPPKATRPSGPGSDRARGVALAGARALNGSGGVLHAAATL
jgi:DNA-binding transcriptional LysR family regulator